MNLAHRLVRNGRAARTRKVRRILLAALLGPVAVVLGACTQMPYAASPMSLPGTIQAENYDQGGEGVAYHDTDAVNVGGAGRGSDGVDVRPSPAGSATLVVGNAVAGEWLEYTVDVRATAQYDIGVVFASGAAGGRAHIEVDGVDLTGRIELAGTGAWTTYATTWVVDLPIPAGRHVLRLAFDQTPGVGEIGNVDALVVRATAGTATPWPPAWGAIAVSPQPRYEAAVSVLGGVAYVFGGYYDEKWRVSRSVVAYSPEANTWTPLGDLPAGMAETHLGVANDGRYIYVAGGFGGNIQDASPSQWISDRVYRFDPRANTWTQITALPEPRGAGGLAVTAGKLHYVSGNSADRETDESEHFVYDLATGRWSMAAPVPEPKDHFSTVLVNGDIYMIGGEHGHDTLRQQVATVHAYDPPTDRWTQVASLPRAKSHAEGSTFVADGRIVMAGGQVESQLPTEGVVSYTPAANAWSTLRPLPVPRQGAVVKRIGNRVIMALGAIRTDQPQSDGYAGGVVVP